MLGWDWRRSRAVLAAAASAGDAGVVQMYAVEWSRDAATRFGDPRTTPPAEPSPLTRVVVIMRLGWERLKWFAVPRP